MATIDILSARDWVELLISAVSVLGGFMAFFSGLSARQALIEHASPTGLAHRVNLGIAEGFGVGVLCAVVAVAILALD
jgi:hypothetical protein